MGVDPWYDRLVDPLPGGGDVVVIDARMLSSEARARIVDAATVLHGEILAVSGRTAGVRSVRIGPRSVVLDDGTPRDRLGGRAILRLDDLRPKYAPGDRILGVELRLSLRARVRRWLRERWRREALAAG